MSTRSGPAPDPGALRRMRSTDAAWTTLPAEGRKGDLPEWPLSAAAAREKHFWALLWAKPQAIMWERQGQELEVAVYVRRLVEAEKRGSSVAVGTLVKQLSEQLGLSLPGMARLRWRIAADEMSDKREAKPQANARPSARERFRVVDGSAG